MYCPHKMGQFKKRQGIFFLCLCQNLKRQIDAKSADCILRCLISPGKENRNWGPHPKFHKTICLPAIFSFGSIIFKRVLLSPIREGAWEINSRLFYFSFHVVQFKIISIWIPSGIQLYFSSASFLKFIPHPGYKNVKYRQALEFIRIHGSICLYGSDRALEKRLRGI